MKTFILQGYMSWESHKTLGVFETYEEVIEEAKDPKNRNFDFIYYDEWCKTERLGGLFLVRNGKWSQESERIPT